MLEITIEHLDKNGTWYDPRVVLHGTLDQVDSHHYDGYIQIIGTAGASQLHWIHVYGKVNLASGEVHLTADIPHDGDIYAAPVPTPVDFSSTVFGYISEDGRYLSFALPQGYEGILQQTAEGVWMGEVNRTSPKPSKIAVPDGVRAEIQLTLK